MKEKTKPDPKSLNDEIEATEADVQKMYDLLEAFANSIGKSKLKEKTLISIFAKSLKMSVRDLTSLINDIKSGRLKRDLFK